MDYEKFLHKAKSEDLTKLIDFLDIEKAKKNPLLFFEKPELLEEALKNVYYIKKKDFGKIFSIIISEKTELSKIDKKNTFSLEFFRIKNWLDHAIARNELNIENFFWFLTLKTDFNWELDKLLEKEDKFYFKVHKNEKRKNRENPWIEQFVIETDWFLKTEGLQEELINKLLTFYDETELENYLEKDKIERAVKKVSRIQEQWKDLCLSRIKKGKTKECYQSMRYQEDFTLLKYHEKIYKKIDSTDLILSFELKRNNTKRLLELIFERSRKAKLLLALKKKENKNDEKN